MSVKTAKLSADNAYERGAKTAFSLRSVTADNIADWTVNGVNWHDVRSYLGDLLAKYGELGDARNAPNVNQAAQDAEGNPAYDFVAEIDTLRTLMVAVKDQVLIDLPKDGNGYRLVIKLNDITGAEEPRHFPPGALTDLLADMQAVVDQVDAV